MAATPTIEQALDRARRVQEARIEAIRALAQARQDVVDTRERAARELAEVQARHAAELRAAEDQDVKVYRAATAAGWTPDELRKIGYDAPDKVARVRRRAAKRTTQSATPTAPSDAGQHEADTHSDGSGQDHA